MISLKESKKCDLQIDGCFTQVIRADVNGEEIAFSFNSEKQLFYKVRDSLQVVYDEIFFNNSKGKQAAVSPTGTHLLIQTAGDCFVVLEDLQNDYPAISCTIKKVPGRKILDFMFLGQDKILFLGYEGSLSIFSLEGKSSVLKFTQRLPVEEDEVIQNLVLDANSRKFYVFTTHSKRGVVGYQQPSGLKIQQQDRMNIYPYSFEGSEMDSFTKESQTCFELQTILDEERYNLQVRLAKNGSIVALVSSKQSQLVSFTQNVNMTGYSLEPHSSKMFDKKIIDFALVGGSLWTLDRKGAVQKLSVPLN